MTSYALGNRIACNVDVGNPCVELLSHVADAATGRLLEEISWEGSRVRLYCKGGLGLENALTPFARQQSPPSTPCPPPPAGVLCRSRRTCHITYA